MSHNGQYAARIGPDCIYWICWIQLLTSGSVPFLCKTGLDPIWMAWSGFGQTHLVRKRTSVQESLGPVCGNWPATSFPLSNSVTLFHGWPGSQFENQPGSDLVLADCIWLSPTGSGPEASWYAKMIQPVFDQDFRSDLAWTCIGSGMFTIMSGSCNKYNFCHDKHMFVTTNMCLS